MPLHPFHQIPQLAYLGLLSLYFDELVIHNLGNLSRGAYFQQSGQKLAYDYINK